MSESMTNCGYFSGQAIDINQSKMGMIWFCHRTQRLAWIYPREKWQGWAWVTITFFLETNNGLYSWHKELRTVLVSLHSWPMVIFGMGQHLHHQIQRMKILVIYPSEKENKRGLREIDGNPKFCSMNLHWWYLHLCRDHRKVFQVILELFIRGIYSLLYGSWVETIHIFTFEISCKLVLDQWHLRCLYAPKKEQRICWQQSYAMLECGARPMLRKECCCQSGSSIWCWEFIITVPCAQLPA